jgi:hypothetical protein
VYEVNGNFKCILKIQGRVQPQFYGFELFADNEFMMKKSRDAKHNE